MIILTAIGRFFKKIWDWIRQTAWIQPLLIVGVIFGIIFSIPSIVKAIKTGRKAKSTYAAYYEQFQLSLEGEKDSAADSFTYDLTEVLLDPSKESSFKEKHSDLGNKFFITFVAQDCPECESAKEGFSQFEKKFEDLTKQSSDPFKMVTIFCDEENKETTDDKPAFWFYLDRHLDFFSNCTNAIYENGYYYNEKLSDTHLATLENADPDNWYSPTIFLVELGEAARSHNFDPGITELMFGVEGSDKNDKARTLADCWTHSGDFSINDDKR